MVDDKMMQVLQKAKGADGKLKDAASDLISKHFYWKQATPATETAGDGAANGTSLCTISITAYKRFICTHLMASTDVGAVIRVGTGALGSMTDIYPIDLMDGGGIVIITEDSVIFHYDNSAGASAVTLRMYVPQTAKGAATNNDAFHHFDAFMGGYEY